MSPLQSYKGQIVRDSKTGKRYEVLGLGRRPGTLRLRDIQDNQIWFNANANWYEPTGASVEDVALPEPEVLRNLEVEVEFCEPGDDLHPSDNPLEW